MTSETVEFESGTEIDEEPSTQQQPRRNKTRMSTEKKKKSGRRRRKCSCSSSIQGGLTNVQHDLPTSRIPIFHRPLSLHSSSTAGFASLSAKQDHNGYRRRRIDKCQNQGSSTARRRSTDDARVAACEFTRVWEEESSTQEEEEDEYASSSSSEEEEEERVDPVRTATHPCFNSTNSISTCHIRSRSRNLSLSNKYRPKTFEDIIGHEINVKALSSAIHNDMVAPLYLFHGPSGTGKTSTATIFAMASNCDSSASAAASASAWPCWNCRGCSTSIYINDLFCSPESRGGRGQGGVEGIKTLLLQSMALARTFKVKVFVIVEEEGCLAWDQLPSIVDYCHHDGSVVLVMVTSSNEGMGASGGAVPKAVSSRCQKFSFPKLKDTDVILKLARIAAAEGIRIDSDALGLIAAKADGSMREAENILEQMSLLGSTITSSMVQQLVGGPGAALQAPQLTRCGYVLRYKYNSETGEEAHRTGSPAASPHISTGSPHHRDPLRRIRALVQR
ncbi:protein STICHEL-like protein 4 isoform X2 [Cinnamomum micranthum f. kanehirae]|uniref:Protein STICHEL-like protein 4 isoform X2 n=1 Tax=Cinnamomum micranthum f. kanehirae TaxID=337451 RepID=A0A443NIJ4_9MAGN|nr:protein STICHEL-like protein 4 isoform X2 [Cinnamomum micranthum f. kanehirae]